MMDVSFPVLKYERALRANTKMVRINPYKIVAFQPSGRNPNSGNAEIHLQNGDVVEVKASCEEIESDLQ